MSKSKISRDEMRRRIEAKERGEGGGEPAPPPVEVTTWAGQANYECVLCAYATLDVGAMKGHLKAVHGWVETEISSQLSVVSEEAAEVVAGEDEISQNEVM